MRRWNAAAERLFGFTAGEVLGRPLDFMIPEHLRRGHDEGFSRAMATGTLRMGGRVLTTRSLRKDGAKLYVDMSFALVRDEAGGVVGSVAMARDVTEAFLAAKLRHSPGG